MTADACVLAAEFVFEQAPFASAHASTLVETGVGLVAAWFGGSAEGAPDVGIWLSRQVDGTWSSPVEVASGGGFPCWNPVLFQPSRGPLLLFYKVGPAPRRWWGRVKTSTDGGDSWSEAIELPAGILGPIRTKPVELAEGSLLAGSSTEHCGWVVHVERFTAEATPENLAAAENWRRTGPLNDPREFSAIQPTVLVHSPQVIQLLCRSQSGVITTVWSQDCGHTWGQMSATSLPNPDAGIDALRLADGRFLSAYNPIRQGRSRLALALSCDGIDWHPAVTLEDSPGEYSYPALIQTRDGLVHLCYTWNRRRIKHVVLKLGRMDGTAI